MPATGTNGVRDRVVQVHDLVTYSFNRTDTYAAVSGVPAAGTQLVLPDNPQAGDRYEFQCTDGSCGPANQISLVPGGAATILGSRSVAFENPFSWGVAIFEGGTSAPGSWMLYSEADVQDLTGNFAQLVNVVPHTQNCGAAAGKVVVAAVMVQVEGSGTLEASWTVPWADDTTADQITHEIVAVPFASGTFSQGTTSSAFVGSRVLPPALQLNAALSQYASFLNADAAGVAANGLLYNGVAPNDAAANAQILAKMVTPTLTGLLSGTRAGDSGVSLFAGTMSFVKSTNPKVGYAKGTQVVLALQLLGGPVNGTVTYAGGISLKLSESVSG